MVTAYLFKTQGMMVYPSVPSKNEDLFEWYPDYIRRDDLNLVQIKHLTEIILDNFTEDDIKNVDYILLDDGTNKRRYYVNKYDPVSEDCFSFKVTMDRYIGFEKGSGNIVMSGSAKRLSVPIDFLPGIYPMAENLNFFTLVEPFQPAGRMITNYNAVNPQPPAPPAPLSGGINGPLQITADWDHNPTPAEETYKSHDYLDEGIQYNAHNLYATTSPWGVAVDGRPTAQQNDVSNIWFYRKSEAKPGNYNHKCVLLSPTDPLYNQLTHDSDIEVLMLTNMYTVGLNRRIPSLGGSHTQYVTGGRWKIVDSKPSDDASVGHNNCFISMRYPTYENWKNTEDYTQFTNLRYNFIAAAKKVLTNFSIKVCTDLNGNGLSQAQQDALLTKLIAVVDYFNNLLDSYISGNDINIDAYITGIKSDLSEIYVKFMKSHSTFIEHRTF